MDFFEVFFLVHISNTLKGVDFPHRGKPGIRKFDLIPLTKPIRPYDSAFSENLFSQPDQPIN